MTKKEEFEDKFFITYPVILDERKMYPQSDMKDEITVDHVWQWIEEQLKEKDKTIEKLNGICAVYDDLLRSKEVKDD